MRFTHRSSFQHPLNREFSNVVADRWSASSVMPVQQATADTTEELRMISSRSLRCALALVFFAAAPAISNAQEGALDTQEGKFSYGLGVQFGMQIMTQVLGSNLPIDVESLALGLVDSLNDDLRLTEEEIVAAMTAVQQEAMARESEMHEQFAMQGDEFRASYASQDGVASTANGVLYRVVTDGDGAMPTLESSVTVHYRGALIDGTEFDSSYSRDEPTTFPLNSIILGWQEVLQLMKAGSKWEVVIPPQLAYGENGAPPAIPPNATLVFEIELLEVL